MLKSKLSSILKSLKLDMLFKVLLLKANFMKKKTCIISGIFGPDFSKVYPAVEGVDCYFFTNNDKLEDEVTSKGWIYVFIKLNVSNDIAVSSFQSKYIKFLQFLEQKRFHFFKDYYDTLIYVDHKFYIQNKQVNSLMESMNKSVLIRKTAPVKNTIWDEYNMAMGQERYKRFQKKTLDYINHKLSSSYSENTRICNTGLICYDLSDSEVYTLTNEIYQDLLYVGTSECQIIWGMVAQNYEDIIQTIDWKSLPMVWKAPL